MTERYPLVYADPAWKYRDEGIRGAAEHHYDTTSLLENVSIIDRFAADHSVLFCWMTWPDFFEQGAAIRLAGFKSHTLGFIWVKTTKTHKLHWGTGGWTRANSEPCWIFSRGRKRPKRIAADVHQVLFAPVGEHSQKPKQVRERIDRMFSPRRKRIELFARERAPGWDSWGDQVPET